MNYRPDIDGLRAIAVLSVMLFHAKSALFSGGYVGVDVFFVISGYLITKIIREDIDAGRFSLAGFYERRARRIMPALFLTIAATWSITFWLYMPPEFKSFSETVIASATFTSNFTLWRQSGYFAGPTEIKPLLHLWSLAVEEQFYLLFPLLMIFLTRWCSRRFRLLSLTGILLVSFGISIWAVARFPGAAFYLTPSRGWEILLGAVLALDGIPEIRARFIAECAGIVGFGMVACAVLLFSSSTPFPGLSATIPCLGTGLLIHSGAIRKTSTSRLLSFGPLAYVGLISYSLYLFHWPLLALARYYWIAPLPGYAAAVILVLAGVAAIVSTRYLERPFRSRQLLTRAWVFTFAGLGSATVLSVGILGYVADGLPNRYPGYAHMVYRDQIPEYNSESCFFISKPASDWRADHCLLSNRGYPTALLWGDSFSAHYAPGIKANSSLIKYDVLQYSVASCAPILDRESTWRPGCQTDAQRALAIVREHSVARVILAAHWDLESRYYTGFFAGLRKTVEALRSLGSDVVVVGPSPQFTFWDSLDAEYRLKARHETTSTFYRFLAFDDDFVAKFKHELPGIRVIDPMPFLCKPNNCQVETNGSPLYLDGGHLSVVGSTRIVRALADQFN